MAPTTKEVVLPPSFNLSAHLTFEVLKSGDAVVVRTVDESKEELAQLRKGDELVAAAGFFAARLGSESQLTKFLETRRYPQLTLVFFRPQDTANGGFVQAGDLEREARNLAQAQREAQAEQEAEATKLKFEKEIADRKKREAGLLESLKGQGGGALEKMQGHAAFLKASEVGQGLKDARANFQQNIGTFGKTFSANFRGVNSPNPSTSEGPKTAEESGTGAAAETGADTTERAAGAGTGSAAGPAGADTAGTAGPAGAGPKLPPRQTPTPFSALSSMTMAASNFRRTSGMNFGARDATKHASSDHQAGLDGSSHNATANGGGTASANDCKACGARWESSRGFLMKDGRHSRMCRACDATYCADCKHSQMVKAPVSDGIDSSAHGIPFPVTMPFSSSSAAQQMPLRLAAKGAGKSGWLCRVKCATDAGLEVDTSCCMCSAPWQPRVANSPSSMGEAENGQGATEGKEGSSATAPSSPPNPPLQEYSEACATCDKAFCSACKATHLLIAPIMTTNSDAAAAAAAGTSSGAAAVSGNPRRANRFGSVTGGTLLDFNQPGRDKTECLACRSSKQEQQEQQSPMRRAASSQAETARAV